MAGGQTLKESAKARMMDAFQEGINKIVPSKNKKLGSGIHSNRNIRKRLKIDKFFKSGSVRLKMTFAEVLTKTINMSGLR